MPRKYGTNLRSVVRGRNAEIRSGYASGVCRGYGWFPAVALRSNRLRTRPTIAYRRLQPCLGPPYLVEMPISGADYQTTASTMLAGSASLAAKIGANRKITMPE